MGDWQPIETAPKDGTKIDVWFKSGRLADAFWTGNGWGLRAADQLGWLDIWAAFKSSF